MFTISLSLQRQANTAVFALREDDLGLCSWCLMEALRLLCLWHAYKVTAIG